MMILWLLACSVPETPAPAPAPVESPPVVESAPTPAIRQEPTILRFINDGDQALVFDRSFGPAAPFKLRLLNAPNDVFGFDDVDDSRSGGWIKTCVCTCGPHACAECESPDYITVELAPKAQYEVPWNGQIRRWTDRNCVERHPVPTGPALLVACTGNGPCFRRELTLPVAGPIEIRASHKSQSTTCAELSPGGPERALTRLLAHLKTALATRPVDKCPATPTCVEASELVATKKAATAPCSTWVVPMGNRIEVIAHLPLPSTHVGGESYAHTTDPDGLHRFSAKYEQ